MGQYHIMGNIDKDESLSSNSFGSGVKLWEMAANDYGIKAAFALLMADQWAGDRVFLVGDYTEKADLNKKTINILDENNIKPEDYYGLLMKNKESKLEYIIKKRIEKAYDLKFKQAQWTQDKEYKEISFNKDYGKLAKTPFKHPSWYNSFENCIIFNSEKNEYLDFGSKSLHSIAGGGTSAVVAYLYLLSTSNGKGGGDLGEFPLVKSGSWTGDKTGIISKQLHCDLYSKAKETGECLDDRFPLSFKEEFVNVHYLSREDFTIREVEKNNIKENMNNNMQRSINKI